MPISLPAPVSAYSNAKRGTPRGARLRIQAEVGNNLCQRAKFLCLAISFSAAFGAVMSSIVFVLGSCGGTIARGFIRCHARRAPLPRERVRAEPLSRSFPRKREPSAVPNRKVRLDSRLRGMSGVCGSAILKMAERQFAERQRLPICIEEARALPVCDFTDVRDVHLRRGCRGAEGFRFVRRHRAENFVI